MSRAAKMSCLLTLRLDNTLHRFVNEAVMQSSPSKREIVFLLPNTRPLRKHQGIGLLASVSGICLVSRQVHSEVLWTFVRRPL